MLPYVVLELFVLIVLPVSLIRLGVLHPKFRVQSIFLVFAVCALLFTLRDTDLTTIGFTEENFTSALEFYGLAALVGVGFVALLARVYKRRFEPDWYKDFHKIVFFVPLSFVQQFIFQGFVLHELLPVFHPFAAVVTTAVLFGYMHTIYPNPLRNMVITTIAGIGFSSLYLYMPNLVAISLCHAVLNFAVINFGFFTYPHGKFLSK